MPTDTLDHVTEAAQKTVASAADKGHAALDKGQAALNEALASAQQKIAESAKVAEKKLREHAETLRVQTKVYRENAGQQIDDAQRYVTERVKERPLTALMAGLGVGLVLGMLLSNRDR
jgi:ElaB/YqjD/DUF883 family membrane-anchored ribosome-binding protein